MNNAAAARILIIDTVEFEARGAAAYAAGRPGIAAVDSAVLDLVRSVGREAARPALAAWTDGYRAAEMPALEAELARRL